MVKDLCAAALFNMMYDAVGRQKLMKDGVLWASIRLATAGGDGSTSPQQPQKVTNRPLSSSVKPKSITQPIRLRTFRSNSMANLLDVCVMLVLVSYHISRGVVTIIVVGVDC